MLSYFPNIYPDEILYSLLARYHRHVCSSGPTETLLDLYGRRSICAVVDLPSSLNILAEQLFLFGLTAKILIRHHTLFPYYTAFIDSTSRERIRQSMLGDYGGDIHTRVGIVTTTVPTLQYLRYCRKCNEEDFENFGEIYWHRLFQVPGVLVCPRHKVLLQDSTAPYRPVNKHEYVAATEENCNPDNNVIHSLSLSSDNFNHLLQIAEASDELLKCSTPSSFLHSTYPDYRDSLYTSGFLKGEKVVNQKFLEECIVHFYSSSLLHILHCDIHSGNEDNWLKKISRKQTNKIHPLRHLLFSIFLKHQKPMKKEVSPFVCNPWPCLNHLCRSFREDVIQDLSLSYCDKTGVPIGTFKCPHCGFTYTRRGPEKDGDERYRFSTVKEYGRVWERELKKQVKKGLSLRATARELQVDPATVKLHAVRQDLKASWIHPTDQQLSSVKMKSTKMKRRRRYRTRWLQLKKDNRCLSKTELRFLDKGTYAWLYRHDRSWLQKNSPKPKKKKIHSHRVDWEKRDREILLLVEREAQAIRLLDPPRRITTSAIGKRIGKLSLLEKKISKLPRTAAFLDRHMENTEAFQIRRIIWVVKILDREGQEIIDWRIRRLAGLKSICTPVVEKAIRNSIRRQELTVNGCDDSAQRKSS